MATRTNINVPYLLDTSLPLLLHLYYLYLLLHYRSLRVALILYYLHTITGSLSASPTFQEGNPHGSVSIYNCGS